MNRKGFSLTELLIVIVLMGIITVMVSGTFLYQQKMMNKEQTISDLNIKARKVNGYIVNEIRKIGLNRLPLTSSTMFGIVSGAQDSLEYTYDSDNGTPGIVDAISDVHKIGLRGDTLYIDNIPALTGVTSINFKYYDSRGLLIPGTQLPVMEVDLNGNSVLAVGSFPVNRIEFTVTISSPDSIKSQYKNTCSIRNIK